MAKEMMKLRLAALLLLGLAIWVEFAAGHGGADDDDDEVDDGSPPPNLRAKGLILVKIYCLIIVFFATIIGGVSPYFFRWNSTFLVLGTQYAGGVFLATALLHFLSDSHNGFQALTTKEYAFGEMLAVVGYLFTMFGDLVIQWVVRRASNSVDEEKGAAKLGQKNQSVCVCAPQDRASCTCGAANGMDNCCEEPIVKETLVHRTSVGDALLLILALCFHSVFEGIAIGVAETKADAWKALWTISLHKVFAAIAMGIALLRMLPNRPFLSCLAYAFAFAISTPVGIAIGIIIDSSTEGAAADWVYAISMGLATGVFIYVAINHLLAKGYTPLTRTALDGPFYKYLAVVAGAATLAVVMIWDT